MGKIRNPNIENLYKQEFQFYFSGVESKNHFTLAKEAGVKHFLMAFHHIRKGGIKGAEIERRFGDGKSKLLVDSSTFTFHTNEEYYDKNKYPISYWEKYIEDYLEWCKAHADIINAIVELDITEIVGVDKVQEWRKKYFIPFEEETGIPVCYVWQKNYGGKRGTDLTEWERMCKTYNYVGFSGELGLPDKQVIKMLQIAKKYGTIVHGFAFTKFEKLKTGRFPFFSVDSISWKTSEMYGVTYIWDGKNFHQYDKTKKHLRKKYKNVLIKQGINWDNIVNDVATETTKMALVAWRGMSEYIRDLYKRQGKMYWLKGVQNNVEPDEEEDDDMDEKDDIQPIFPPPQEKWEESTGLDWREVAESMNINPNCADESVVLTIIDILTALHFHTNSKYGRNLYHILSKNEGIVDYIYETYVEGNYTPEGDEVSLPKALLPFLDDDEDYDPEEMTYNGNSLEKLGILMELTPKVLDRQLNIFRVEQEEPERPKPPKERKRYAGDEDREIVALALRNPDGTFAKGNQEYLKRSRSMLAHVPSLACNTCYAADNCPYFEPDSVCYYNKELQKFDTRRAEDVLDAHADITNMAIQRLLIARIFEVADGGMPDKMVTDLINQTSGLLQTQRSLQRAMNPSPSDGIQITASGQVGNSIIAQLFGGLGQKPEERKPVDVKAKSSTVSKIFDAEFEDIEDDDEEDKPKKKKAKKLIKKKKK
jgi:hypothetical protein